MTLDLELLDAHKCVPSQSREVGSPISWVIYLLKNCDPTQPLVKLPTRASPPGIFSLLLKKGFPPRRVQNFCSRRGPFPRRADSRPVPPLRSRPTVRVPSFESRPVVRVPSHRSSPVPSFESRPIVRVPSHGSSRLPGIFSSLSEKGSSPPADLIFVPGGERFSIPPASGAHGCAELVRVFGRPDTKQYVPSKRKGPASGVVVNYFGGQLPTKSS
jgi:hypothetical protein